MRCATCGLPTRGRTTSPPREAASASSVGKLPATGNFRIQSVVAVPVQVISLGSSRRIRYRQHSPHKKQGDTRKIRCWEEVTSFLLGSCQKITCAKRLHTTEVSDEASVKLVECYYYEDIHNSWLYLHSQDVSPRDFSRDH